ncbi:GpE family phage tail protein [Novosphingobium aquae]|uniref:GpE family phage tail protein n=1 Tax=Novosphingobium aquae TaxID=3133435 RepID=A0ABU8S3Z5_9SPHN
MIATIAFIFHWPLSEISALSFEELAIWHELAVDRWNKAYAAEED